MECRLITVKIETVSDAFSGRTRAEVARILRHVANRLAEDVDDPPFYLRDCNDHRVGIVTIK